jgi:hypothetical protein
MKLACPELAEGASKELDTEHTLASQTPAPKPHLANPRNHVKTLCGLL